VRFRPFQRAASVALIDPDSLRQVEMPRPARRVGDDEGEKGAAMRGRGGKVPLPLFRVPRRR
jgi:hypothetical protein